WTGAIEPLAPAALDGADLAVDAIFGAGLARALDGAARATVEAIDARGLASVAVDVPSGVEGDTGRIAGAAPHARLTVTFFRRKPGHILLPGRLHCGEVVVADIGIAECVLASIGAATFANDPALWSGLYPWPTIDGHKYDRGHALVLGGAVMTGAGRLAARAALRIGAGLVTIASPRAAVPIYAGDLGSLIVRPAEHPEDITALLADGRRNAVLVGPGAGGGDATRAAVMAVLATGRRAVIDADALTAFAGDAAVLFAALRGREAVLTPHDGEFARLFGAERGDRLARARAAAARAGVVVLLKGPDSVIAAPDGRAAINANAPRWLATAGTGDVLAGLVLGLLAQGMAPFEAACAATWVHGRAATIVGPGLVADDLPATVPAVLRELLGTIAG
ncbi:MAG: NAD(P)H-hydrate dehydratase, partial [Alphaproteobacteria bacterium]|nr:NAD(P)H-hydrate dehydratase [Alphaproteobacteria bacterium]